MSAYDNLTMVTMKTICTKSLRHLWIERNRGGSYTKKVARELIRQRVCDLRLIGPKVKSFPVLSCAEMKAQQRVGRVIE